MVELKGLLVDIPPKSRFTHAPETQGSDGDTGKPKGSKALLQFEVGSIVCTGAHLTPVSYTHLDFRKDNHGRTKAAL